MCPPICRWSRSSSWFFAPGHSPGDLDVGRGNNGELEYCGGHETAKNDEGHTRLRHRTTVFIANTGGASSWLGRPRGAQAYCSDEVGPVAGACCFDDGRQKWAILDLRPQDKRSPATLPVTSTV